MSLIVSQTAGGGAAQTATNVKTVALTPKEWPEDFAPDLSPAESSVMQAVQGPLSAAFTGKATQAAWRENHLGTSWRNTTA